ncbi:cobalt-precorrin 5A hydrolase [Desertibacillus haloalkaliphilus]|uniref:cobalt-precorrin 5A hydrolase n=1 Tax=Desertibacillus haloalkaliphilus TaxID=1328930 RepID=UPI001C25F371|nr:cobalamin biosynthesis protein [Desertibacillus haloalkaliphilus]MBU8907815.1 cobalamin biosynthesis protein [Desertibacillus haloalkaliphilus]
MDNVALVAITKHGVELVRSLQPKMPRADVYYMTKFAKGDETDRQIQMFEGSVRLLLPELFKRYDGVVMVISLGAVVRMIAPILKDKKTDPAVVVVDDKAEFVISVLSGHIGGANDLTRELSDYLQATPVITTASDVQKTIPVDIFGREFGWEIEDFTHVTPVSAAVVNEEPVVIVQESGERAWWKHEKPLPTHFQVVSSCEEALQQEFQAALVITHSLLSKSMEEQLLKNGVLYRPKSVYLGMGCNRGTTAEEIEQVIKNTLEEVGISLLSVKEMATIDLKKDEQGLLEVCEKYNWNFTYYTPEQLNEIKIDNPSDTVFKYTGAYGVSEPAAKRSAGVDKLLLEKKKSGNVTISIAVN